MTTVGFIDLLSFVALAMAIVGILRRQQYELSRESMFLLLAIALVSLFQALPGFVWVASVHDCFIAEVG